MKKDQSKSQKKLANYFSALIESDKFRDFHKKTRQEMLDLRANKQEGLAYKERKKYLESYLPTIVKKIRAFCGENGLNYPDFFPLILQSLELESLNDSIVLSECHDLARVKDLLEPGNAFYRDDVSDMPISIHFSPYISENELVEFIKKNYSSHIKPIQEKYRRERKFKIGKFSGRNSFVIARNKLIMQLHEKGKTGSEIADIVNEKFKLKDDRLIVYNYVNQIIKLEKERKKQL